MPNDIDIVMVDPNEINGEGLRRILVEHGFRTVELYRSAGEIDPERMVSRSKAVGIVTAATDALALEICIDLHARWPGVKILIMAYSCRSQLVADAFRGGADGYVSRDISCAGLAETLKLIALGEKMIPSQVVFDLTAPRTDPAWNQIGTRIADAHVSEREIEILQGLIAGEPNKVISRRLGITEATVKVHVKSILRKLNVMNRTQAAIWGVSRGLEAHERPHAEVPFAGEMASLHHLAIAGPQVPLHCGVPDFGSGHSIHNGDGKGRS